MASIISAGTTSGTSLNLSGDTSGVLQLATNGSTTAITVDTSQNVGIGTTSPATKLQISESGAGPTVTLNRLGDTSGNAVIRSTGSTGTINASITLGGGSDNLMTFATGTSNTERMRITSTGVVSVGSSTVAGWTSPFNAIQLGTTATVMATSGSTQLGQNIYYDGSYKFIGTGYANRYYQNNGDHTWTASSASGSAGGAVTENIVLTLSSSGCLVLKGGTGTASVGIAFPATQSASSNANTLDDYEEGTWTPVIGGDAGTSGQSYSSQTGVYRKIGGFVYACFDVTLSAKGTITGTLTIAGFPFAASGTANVGNAGGPIVYWGSLATSWNMIGGHFGNGNTYMNLYGATGSGNTTTTGLNTNDVNNTSRFMGFAVYPAS